MKTLSQTGKPHCRTGFDLLCSSCSNVISAHLDFSNRTLHEDLNKDLSSDETEKNGLSQYRNRDAHAMKCPFVAISDDDDDDSDPIFHDAVFSSTLIQKKKTAAYKPEESHRKWESSRSFPSVAPVNSLKDRQQSLSCLKADKITQIFKKHQEFYKQKDVEIQDTELM